MSARSRLVLDTHVWLWFALGIQGKFRPAVLRTIELAAESSNLHVSIVSVWEIAMLVAKERVSLPIAVDEWISAALAPAQIKLVGLSRIGTVLDSVKLPGTFHADAADRFLIATARNLRATLVTHDADIIAYAKLGHLQVLAV